MTDALKLRKQATSIQNSDQKKSKFAKKEEEFIYKVSACLKNDD